VTFADYAPEWIRAYRGRTARGIGQDTLADYRRALGLDVDGKPTGEGAVGFFGRTLLAEIGAPELRAFADHVSSRGVRRQTVRLALAPVKALLATAHEDGLIRHNPAAGLRNLLPADEDREADVVKALAPDELAALLDAMPDAWRPFFEFLAETGLRVGEAVEVRWSDVDLGGRWLTVGRRYYRGRVGLPKGRKTRRVPLSPRVARSLWTMRGKAADGDLVFMSERGGRVDQSNVMSRVLKPAAVEAGLGVWVVDGKARGGRRAESWVGFHTFRHTCATMLLRGGWNAPQAQRLLGHSDPGFTLRRYVHLLDADLPEVGFLDSLSGGPGDGAHGGLSSDAGSTLRVQDAVEVRGSADEGTRDRLPSLDRGGGTEARARDDALEGFLGAVPHRGEEREIAVS
jgi:integrase